MARIRVVTDSACDLSAEMAAERGLTIVPLSIRFGTEEFVDGLHPLHRRVLGPVQGQHGAPRDLGTVPRCLPGGLLGGGRCRLRRCPVHQPVLRGLGHPPGRGGGGQGRR